MSKMIIPKENNTSKQSIILFLSEVNILLIYKNYSSRKVVVWLALN